MKRRAFLKNTGLASAALGLGALGEGCSNIKFEGKRLILVKLDGGNDSLFSIMPAENDQINQLRPNIAADVRKKGIPFFNNWLLNYELRLLESLAGLGELAVLPFVGYPNPNTSHFKSTEIWETGAMPGEKSGKTGWIGQLLDDGTLANKHNEAPVLSLSELETLVTRGAMKQGHTWTGNTTLEWYENNIRDWLDYNRNSLIGDKLLREYNLLKLLSDTRPVSGFPATSLGDQLSKVAGIIQQEKPFTVFYTTHEGYDTHTSASIRLLELYSELSAALSALVKTLKSSSQWNDTMIMVYSEFGRTIDENANGGTDHGAAGLTLLLGSNQIVKKYASIEPEIKLVPYHNEMYLGHQIDFRNLYADIRMLWLA